MAEHTAGPWTVHKGQSCYHVISQGSVFSTGCISFDGNGLANAHLIAAAPELLAALKIAEELLERNGVTRPEIAAAIAKAEGRA